MRSCLCGEIVIMNIEDRRILITGASRGLGRTLAFAFAQAGAREVLAGARKAEDVDTLKREAAANKAPIVPIYLDVMTTLPQPPDLARLIFLSTMPASPVTAIRFR